MKRILKKFFDKFGSIISVIFVFEGLLTGILFGISEFNPNNLTLRLVAECFGYMAYALLGLFFLMLHFSPESYVRVAKNKKKSPDIFEYDCKNYKDEERKVRQIADYYKYSLYNTYKFKNCIMKLYFRAKNREYINLLNIIHTDYIDEKIINEIFNEYNKIFEEYFKGIPVQNFFNYFIIIVDKDSDYIRTYLESPISYTFGNYSIEVLINLQKKRLCLKTYYLMGWTICSKLRKKLNKLFKKIEEVDYENKK